MSIQAISKTGFLALVISTGSSCSETQVGANHNWLTFLCPDGQSIQARFEPEDKFVSMRFSGQEVRLPHVISGSGARYSDGKITFWNKGNAAMIEIDDRIVVQNCILHAD